jgi:arylsulfatase
MLSALRGETTDERPLYWEHTGNAAIRLGEWKLVRGFGADWELYAMHDDRVELHDVAASHPQVVRELAEEWERWAERAEVIPWRRIVDHYAGRGRTEEEAWM